MTHEPNRREFLAAMVAAASIPIIGCGVDESVDDMETIDAGLEQITEQERVFNGVFSDQFLGDNHFNGTGAAYIAGWHDNLVKGPMIEKLVAAYQVGTASPDSVLLSLLTAPVELNKREPNSSYNQLLIQGNPTLLSQAKTGKQRGFRWHGATKRFGDNHNGLRFYKILVEGLEPGNTYDFKLSNSDKFKGALRVPDAKDFKFVVGGDFGYPGKGSKRVQLCYGSCAPTGNMNDAIRNVDGIDFAVGLGDFVGDQSTGNWIDDYLDKYDSLQSIPMFPALGNHDLSAPGKRGNMKLRSHKGFTDFFGSMSRNDDRLVIGANASEPVNYSFDVGDVHFIVLDSCVNKKYNRGYKQAVRFLEKDLADNANCVNLVFSHHPFHIPHEKTINKDVYSHVNAWFAGHNHEYSRYTVKRDEVDPRTTHYVTTGFDAHTKAGRRHPIQTLPKKYVERFEEACPRVAEKHLTVLHYIQNGRHRELNMEVTKLDGTVIDKVRLH